MALLVVQYIFNITTSNLRKLQRLDRKRWKLSTFNNNYLPGACVDYPYLTRNNGKIGIIHVLELSYKTSTIATNQILSSTDDWRMHHMRKHILLPRKTANVQGNTSLISNLLKPEITAIKNRNRTSKLWNTTGRNKFRNGGQITLGKDNLYFEV